MIVLFSLLACHPADDVARHRPGDTGADAPATGLQILSPTAGAIADNPVTFTFQVDDPAVTSLAFTCEGTPLHDDPLSTDKTSYTYRFSGVNYERRVRLTGYDDAGDEVAHDAVTFVPAEGLLPDEAGFNHYMVEAINDGLLYPRDGTYPYCLSDDCGDMWGMIRDAYYLGEDLFTGGGDCFCTGFTLEILLDAYSRWQDENQVSVTDPWGDLTLDDVAGGDFYQHWQGYGVAGSKASSADALEYAGIGEEVPERDWPTATTGDLANISRSTGSGHSILFVDWITQGDEITGIRYYGCNGSGESHPDPEDPDDQDDISGPSFQTEMFEGHGGTVLPSYLYLGHPYDPSTL